MDINKLLTDTNARFNLNTSKTYLKEKYQSKLIVSDQSGLWKATPELIGYLSSSSDEYVILVDVFENPVRVNRLSLYNTLNKLYNAVMGEWYSELKILEKKQ